MYENQREKVIEVLKYYKNYNSYITPKTIYKKTGIKTNKIRKILYDIPEAQEFSYSVVGSGKSSGKLWKLC
jgi:transcription initiation factor IIE alpha subunit